MYKLATFLIALLAVFTTLATAAEVKLGWCYTNGDCTGDHSQVNGIDNQSNTNLMTADHPHCASFLSAPDPPATVYVCQQGCNGGCIFGVVGKCTVLTPGSPKGTRFQCAKRV